MRRVALQEVRTVERTDQTKSRVQPCGNAGWSFYSNRRPLQIASAAPEVEQFRNDLSALNERAQLTYLRYEKQVTKTRTGQVNRAMTQTPIR